MNARRSTKLILKMLSLLALASCSASSEPGRLGARSSKKHSGASPQSSKQDQDDGTAIPPSDNDNAPSNEASPSPDASDSAPILEDASGDTVTAPQTACKPVRKYAFPINSGVSIGCSTTQVVSVQVPDKGYAAARATLPFKHNGGAWHVWAGNVAVGVSSIATYSGSDMCPTALTSDAIHGYGHLADGSNTVTVNVVANALSCVAGTISTSGQGTLEVWVEDDRPACQKQFIVASNYQSINSSYWDYSLTPQSLLHVALPADPNNSAKSLLSAIGHIEGTTYSNPNSCDNEYASLGLFGSMDGRAIGQDSSQYKTIPGIVPGAYGHVINNIAVSHPIGPEAHTFDMLPQNGSSANGRVVTGSNFGDAVLIVIREPASP